MLVLATDPTRLRSVAATLLLLALGGPRPVWAQGQGQGAPTSVVTRWGVADGLPQVSVTDIVQDDRGYLWISTFGGLARFDGHEFHVFSIATTPGFEANRLTRLAIDSSRNLFALWQDGGLTRYDGTAFQSYRVGAGEDRPEGLIVGMATHARDGLWLISSTTISRWENGEARGVSRIDPRVAWPIHAAAGGNGVVWMGTRSGLLRFAGDELEEIAAVSGHLVQAVAVDAQDRVWIGSEAGLLRLDGERLDTLVADGPVPRLAIGADRRVAFLNERTQTVGVLADRPGEPEIVYFDVPFPSSAGARVIFLDRQGNLWLGTDRQGLFRVRAAPVKTFGPAQGLGIGSGGSLVEDADGAVLVTEQGACRGIWRIAPEGVRNVVPGQCPAPMLRDRDGAIWLVFQGILRRMRAGDMTDYRFMPPPAPTAHAVLQDGEGRIWIGTTNGLVRFDSISPVVYRVADGLPSNNVHALAEGRDGALWIGTRAGLSRFAGGRFTSYDETDGLSPGIIRALHWDTDGVLWIGTYGGGLNRYADGRFTRYTTADGLFDDAISAILEDDAGNLWMNTNRGVFAMARDDLNAFARGASAFVSPVQAYGVEWGVPEGNGGGKLKATDGRLWFPTVEGVVVVDPVAAIASAPTSASALIESVRIDGRTFAPTDAIAARPGMRNVEVDYTSIDLVQPQALRFRYRLDGVDPDWVDAGTRRVAFYTNVPAGRRTFRVQASRSSSGWGDEAVLSFRLEPRFYETAWFVVVALSLALGLLYQAHRYRLVRIRRHRDALQESESRFRGATSGSLDGFFLLESVRDENGAIEDFRFVDLNDRGADLVGATRAELIGRPVTEVLTAVRDAGVIAKFIEAVETRVPFEEELRTMSPVMRAEWVRQQVVPVGDGLAVSVRDLTEQRRAALEREQLQRELAQAQKMEAVGLLAGGVAHDFNNILMVVTGNAELLGAMLPEDAPGRENLRDVMDAAARGAQLTQQLLAFTRKQVTEPRLLDPAARVMALDKMVRRLLGSDVELVTIADDDVPPVWMDPTQLEQVLLNLAVNAKDAMPAGGTLTLGVDHVTVEPVNMQTSGLAAGSYVRFSVRDTGLGMTPEVMAHIFEPFFTTKGPARGTGLGLATCKRIVDESGGVITVDSTPEVGSTFDVYLPVAAGEIADDTARRKGRDGAIRPGSERLLLLEDSGELRSMMTYALETHGYRVHATGMPSDAVEAVEKDQDIRLVIADVVLPQQSGIGVAKAMRRVRPDLKVLFISGYLGEEPQDEVRQIGDFLPKPFAPSVLVRRVREILDDGA